MNLIELFDSLSYPIGKNKKVFTAIPIPNYPNCRIAIDIDGNPTLLLKVFNPSEKVSLKNFRFKYLQLQQNIECKVTENGKTYQSTFTIITFYNTDQSLQEYFLRISEPFIKSLNARLTDEEILYTIMRFVEVFRTLGDTPMNTVHGLWSELFLIDTSKNPKILLNYWHNFSDEKFDFNSGAEKIEVKSNSNYERIHTFSSEQLNPKEGTQALVASIFVRQSNTGQSIRHLINSIIDKINNDIELTDKLNTLVCKILGNSLEQAIKIKFDYQIASESLRFYKHQDISKIEEIHIPSEVTEVKYKSDLSDIKAVSPQEISSLILFNSL
jgi:hypothetical protein